jgi:CHAT domain-containing protein
MSVAFLSLRAIQALRHTLLALLAAVCLMPAGAAERGKIGLQDIFAAFDSQPIDQEHLKQLRSQASAQAPKDADTAALARFYGQRARANEELGLVVAQLADLRRLVELGGGDDPVRARHDLGQAEFFGGNIGAAIDTQEKALALIPANMRGRQLAEHTSLADLYRRIGDFAKARRHVRDAEGLLVVLRAGRGWQDNQYGWQGKVEDALGRIEMASGHYAEAEARFRKAIELIDLEIADTPAGDEKQFNLLTRRDALENWLSQSLWRQGKLYEAEVHARSAAYNSLRRSGQDSIRANTNTMQLISALAEQDQLDAALQLTERVGRSFERQGVPPTAFFAARNNLQHAALLSRLGRWQESIQRFEANRRVLAADAPELAARLGGPNLAWIRALIAVGEQDAAVAMGRQLHAQQLAQLGPQAYETLETEGFLGAALARRGDESEALTHFRNALAGLLPRAVQSDRSTHRFRRLSFILESYLSLLARQQQKATTPGAAAALADEAFTVADALRGQSVRQAMAASAARAAAGSPELAALARREQDARQERDALLGILADLMSRRADQTPPAIIADMRERVAALDSQLKSLGEEIHRRFPAYAELLNPRPTGITALRPSLRPGEALLTILDSDEQTYVWAIPASGDASFAAVPISRKTLTAQVARLRASLDPGDVNIPNLPAFDGDTAYALYRDLLLPVQAGWAGADHLIVAAGGPLGRLPLAVLLTAPPPGAGGNDFSGYAQWPWLIRQAAISQLPAAGSLTTLRGLRPGRSDRKPLAAFGDPDFRSPEASQPLRRIARLRAFRATLRDSRDILDYSLIPPLPDTREEVLALANTLHADPQHDVFLGRAASRQTVLETRLDDRRVVALATHGLVAGEYPGVDQPSLALANPGGGEHGLLTLDDILGLKLDADWVILSACNTSAGDGQGGEAISGLGRGFFYAGTRALLVTHWPVETVSAKRLVVGVFDALAADPALTRAHALQRSMLRLMDERGEDGKFHFRYAHPLFWAPYALVGDGDR